MTTLALERPAARYQEQSETIIARRAMFEPKAIGRQLREALA
jgi:hypothetical protein